jgi:phosphate starvation-inducible PhoH-like protein
MGKSKNNDNDFDTNENKLYKIKTEIGKILKDNIKIVAKNDSQKLLIKSIKENEITICNGPAGTGKTFIAIGIALNLLKNPDNNYKNIYLVKSVTTLKNEELGFLKGNLKEKIEPFMWSFYINFEKLIEKSTLNMLLEAEIIKPFPLAYMRGASLDDCIIIGDEFQNVNLDNSRTQMTRIGTNCKLILLGDENQIDMKNKHESSLSKIIKLFSETPKIGTISMSSKDTNVRNPLITEIENKFKELYAKE